MNVDLLRAYDEMFQTKGWKNLLAEAAEELTMIKEQLLYNAPDFDHVCHLRGQAFQLDRLITLEDSLIAMVQAEQTIDEEEPDSATI